MAANAKLASSAPDSEVFIIHVLSSILICWNFILRAYTVLGSVKSESIHSIVHELT